MTDARNRTPDTEREQRFGRTLTRILILLGVLVSLPLAQIAFGWLVRSGDDGPILRGESGLVYLLIDGTKFLARDKDGDGAVDCMLPPGPSSMTGENVFRAEGYEGRCARLGTPAMLSAAARDALSRLVVSKADSQASHTSCLDPDRDGVVDCVVSVHEPELVIFRAPGGRCPGDDGDGLSSEAVAAFSAILADEQIVRAAASLPDE